MSAQTSLRLLWLTFLATLPVAYFTPEGELAPVLRLAFLTVLISVVYLIEGSWTLFSMWLLASAQLLIWCGVLYAVARLATRPLAPLSDPTRGFVTIAIAGLLFGLAYFEIYATPLSSQRMRSNVFGLFE